MRTHLLLSALTVVGAVVAMTPQAHAETFSVHLEPGMAQSIGSPQENIFGTGLTLGAKGLFLLNRNVAVGPSVSTMYLPHWDDTNKNAGVLWQFGGSIRLQGNHNAKSGWSPWIDADLMAAATGNLWRPAFDVGLGEEMALDQEHEVWFGPFLRYSHVLQTSFHQDGASLDRNDPQQLIAGLSFTFDFPPKKQVVNHTEVYRSERIVFVPIHPDNTGTVATATAAPASFDLSEHVYFDWDKSVLRWESRDKLDEVAGKLNQHPKMTIHVQGHASSDGQLSHNQQLAVARTIAVVNYLVNHGHVDINRLKAEPCGIDYPAASNAFQEGRERNRRVQFEVNFSSDSK